MNNKKNSFISRKYNNIIVNNDFVYKTSEEKNNKLLNEFKWFENAKKYIHLPKVKKINNGYKIEYIDGENLGESFWYYDLEKKINILNKYFCLLSTFKKIKSPMNDLLSYVLIDKFEERINKLPKKIKNDLSEIINFYENNIYDIVKKFSNERYYSLMHGDLFFGNTIFNSGQLNLLDPRGFHQEYGIYGNIYYDIIKLSHSVHGHYDKIIFDINIKEKDEIFLNNYFFRKIEKKFFISKGDVLIGEMGLFISMIPLHSDSQKRQLKFVEQAKKIFKEIMEWKK